MRSVRFAPFAAERRELRSRHRAGEQVTLSDRAAEFFECFSLIVRFNTFAHRGDAQIVRKVDDAFEYLRFATRCMLLLDEASVEFEDVDGQLAQQAQ